MVSLALLIIYLAVATAFPHDDVVSKLASGLRYQYLQGPEGTAHLTDLWMKIGDLQDSARFDPDLQNEYHLFTRANPTISQPLVLNNVNVLQNSNFDPSRRTVVLFHGWLASATSDFNIALVPAFLAGEDVNVIVVDWRIGAGPANYATAVINTVTSGEGAARFLNWLNEASGAVPENYHLVGHGLGGHQVGVVGRNMGGQIAYITALDPAFAGFVTNDDKFRPEDGLYTEVIHTNAGLLGYMMPLGQVDFYPNGGVDMPGCITQECDHARSFHYLAESVQTGGFTGSRCATFITAMAGNCFLWGNLSMGGLQPKHGSMGIYHLRTNIFPPFSRG